MVLTDEPSSSPAFRSPASRFVVVGRIAFSLAVFAGLWLTVMPSDGERLLQVILGVIAVLGAAATWWFPLVGALISGIATAVAWMLGVTADPFLLASVGVLTLAERRGTRRLPWWLFASCLLLAIAALVFGSAPGQAGVDVLWRGVLLSAVVLAVAWSLGVRSRQAREETAAHARAVERLRLARDVHDVLSHSLGAIGVQAGVAAHVTALTEMELRETLREVEAQARDSLADLTTLLHRERSSSAETDAPAISLTQSLGEVVGVAERSGLRVELDCAAELDAIPATVRTTLHRVVQEAATNTIRHADASTLAIRVELADEAVEVSVRDDGRRALADFREGHGLTGMRERVALLDGTLHIESTSAGFAVIARLPLSDEGTVRS